MRATNTNTRPPRRDKARIKPPQFFTEPHQRQRGIVTEYMGKLSMRYTYIAMVLMPAIKDTTCFAVRLRYLGAARTQSRHKECYQAAIEHWPHHIAIIAIVRMRVPVNCPLPIKSRLPISLQSHCFDDLTGDMNEHQGLREAQGGLRLKKRLETA